MESLDNSFLERQWARDKERQLIQDSYLALRATGVDGMFAHSYLIARCNNATRDPAMHEEEALLVRCGLLIADGTLCPLVRRTVLELQYGDKVHTT